jgi:hypothetical protein
MNHRLTICMCLLAAFSVGCARAHLTVLKPLPAPERQVTLEFNRSAGDQLDSEESGTFRSILTSRVTDMGIQVVSSTNPDAHTAMCTVDRFDPGSRFLRWFIGLGAGTGRLDTTWDVTNGSGEVIGSCEIDGVVNMGVFGGSFDAVLEKSADKLGDFLEGETD